MAVINLSFRDYQHIAIAAGIPRVQHIISTILFMVTFAVLAVCMYRFDLDNKNQEAPLPSKRNLHDRRESPRHSTSHYLRLSRKPLPYPPLRPSSP